MNLFTPTDSRPVHFVGIGGAGMSALALIACRRGVVVSGCDTEPAGVIVAQDPQPDAELEPGAYVYLTTSTGPEAQLYP